MAITGASRKQAGLYYDKGGAVFNVMHPDFAGGAKGDGTTDDSAAIQAALTAAAGLVPVLIPRTASNFKIGTALSVPSNTHLQIDGLVQMSTRLDALFTATSQSNIHISGKGKVKGTNTSYSGAVSERLFYFVSCSDLSLEGLELSETVVGCQMESCTDWDFNCRVRNILSQTDHSQGYGILTTLASSRWRIAGRFYTIGRHAVYISSGASNGVVDDVVIDTCEGAGISIFATAAQSAIKGIVLGSIRERNIGFGAQTVSRFGINVFGNVDTLSITSGVSIDTVEDNAINIEGDPAATPATNPRNIAIDAPLVQSANIGLRLVNVAHATLVKPRIRNITTTALIVTVNGAGTGSFTDDVDIGSYDIDTATTGINVSGDAAATNVSLGWGHIKSISGSKFNIPATNTAVRYVGPGHTFDYTELALAASQVDNPFVGNVAAAYWAAPEAGYITELFGRCGALSGGNLTIRISKNGVASNTLKVDIVGGTSTDYFFARIPIGTFAVAFGDTIGLVYTTDAGFTPSGARNVEAQVRFVPFP